jgi:glycerate-2-kinase
MIIKNLRSLAITFQRKRALAILEAGYQSINVQNALARQMKLRGNTLIIGTRRIDLTTVRRIGFVGIGKCANQAGIFIEHLLGKHLYGGMALDVQKHSFKKITSLVGTHPLPSEKNIRATRRVLGFIKTLDPKHDLLIAAISGGGSSVFFMPDGIGVRSFINLTNDLHKSGANIHELNCVRKHLSAVQGGKLARQIYPLRTVALYVSDVLSATNTQNLRTIASGSLYPDTQTNADARRTLRKYGLWNKYRKAISHFSETEKNKKYFATIVQALVLDNTTAVQAMARKAKLLGFKPAIVSTAFRSIANKAFQKFKKQSIRFKSCMVFLGAGETTVRVTGSGMGGRNQESVLAALKTIKPDELFIASASDGIDNTPIAGAIADSQTLRHTLARRLNPDEYLANNNSYRFFRKTKDCIKTGSTGSNVADLFVYLKNFS